MRPRTGATFIEQLAVLTLFGALFAIAMRSGTKLFDQAAVSSATRAAADAFAAARDHAVSGGRRVAVHIHPAEASLVIHTGADTLSRHPLGEHHKVALESSRDSMAYAASGLGWGASNLRLVVRRGAAADTLTVSRLGRVRYQ
jgi:type II secretory pathway pseudopilin PulG